jgi:uncharacterized protein (TIGR02757 family)
MSGVTEAVNQESGLCRRITRIELDELYARYNRREWVHPDPLVFLYEYEDLNDREIVGIIASSLAYGRVAQIHKSISSVLAPMGRSPSLFLRESSLGSLQRVFQSFKHRFTDGNELAALLFNTRRMVEEYGSLQRCFAEGLHHDDATILPALASFVGKLSSKSKPPGSMLLPSPEKGSACKRLHLFLRWMVRRDEVDPGGWDLIKESKLIVPLDTHMHRIGLMLGLTGRSQADQRTAIEITESFRRIIPEDPVRYDFALTRSGILNNEDIKSYLRKFAVRGATRSE